MAMAIGQGTCTTLLLQIYWLVMMWREELQPGKRKGRHQLVKVVQPVQRMNESSNFPCVIMLGTTGS
uniref:Uncharacterized protein n=1 Tax=Oryza brachyantha TaxID=4533 RepID=J3MEY4_ORYBR